MKSAFQTFSTYLWSTGNAWTDLQLLLEGAVSLYENECTSLANTAAKEEKTETILLLIPSVPHCMSFVPVFNPCSWNI